jgi:predicted Fe-Mo cluster-binding NifX family protein
LVVNASVAAVTSGQTSPQALLALHRKGVRIYSNAQLHAKVYVFGSKAFIGS